MQALTTLLSCGLILYAILLAYICCVHPKLDSYSYPTSASHVGLLVLTSGELTSVLHSAVTSSVQGIPTLAEAIAIPVLPYHKVLTETFVGVIW